jgi:hypothetical protein
MSNDNPFETFALKLQEMAQVLDNTMPDLISTAVMVELEAKHKQRIFAEGKNSEGEQIGEYSKKPAYYTKQAFVRTSAFKPQGKENRGKFKNGKERKSMYLAEGYTELRDIQGRQTEFVNAKVTGGAERSVGIVKFGEAVLYGVRDLLESKKLHGLIERFGDFLSLSVAEQEFTKEEIKNQAIIVMKQYGE